MLRKTMYSYKYLISLLVLFLSYWLWNITSKLYSKTQFCIVFDAGSTATRMHVFEAIQVPESNSWRIKKEFIDYTSPGLSDFVKNTSAVRTGIEQLLKVALQEINGDANNVKVMLGATAGLRLVGEGAAEALLNEVSVVLQASPFKVVSVSILPGGQEGFLSWISVAHLTDNGVKTVGILDLGGGSTQATFVLGEDGDGDGMDERHVVVLRDADDGGQRRLYSQSHLGLGLKSARLCVLGGGCHGGQPESGSSAEPSRTLFSACLPHGYKGVWRLHGHEFAVASNLSGVSLRDACYRACSEILTDQYHHGRLRLSEAVLRSPFYIFGYFFDRAADAGLSLGSDVTPARYWDLATHACNHTTHENPFHCLDLVYIFSLLHDGYGFPLDSNLKLMKQIDNVNLGWPVGAALDILGGSR